MRKVSKELVLAARKELKRRAARISLANFVTYTYPEYQLGWFHSEVCQALDEFLQDIVEKKSPRLIICAPPRSGKSELVSRRFPAYVLGRYPDLSFIGTSYSSDLAGSFSKDVQRIMEEPSFHEVFPDVYIPAKGIPSKGAVRQADRFDIIDYKGSYYTVGVGGSLTGRGANCLVIDDPVSNMQDALSERVRDSTWDWYTSTAYTRLAPGGGLIVMCTRWHMDDLIGRLLTAQDLGEGDNWKVINFPAIAEFDEQYRKAGEALHPERFNLDALLKIRKSVGERVWAALYQQHPVPDGGGLFKADWIQHWTPETLPEHFDAMVMSWDMTFKETNVSDFVVGQVWGREGANFYLLDQVRARMDFVKTLDAFVKLVEKWPNFRRRLVEDKANGPAIISALKDKITGIIPITPKESKEARAASVTTLWEAGNVWLPPVDTHPWVKREFIPELLSFPAGAHDDQCFEAGTLIATAKGDVPIEQIKPGDYVVTPFGFKRVLSSGITGFSATISKYGLRATPNHPFITKDGSLVHFESVNNANECSRMRFCDLWNIQKKLSSTELNIDSWGVENTTSVNQKQIKEESELKGFMLPCGNSTQAGKCRKAMRYITKTATRLITISATLSVYHVMNTAQRLISRLKMLKSILLVSDILQVIGIRAKKAGLGTKITQNNQRKTTSNVFVFNVEKFSYQNGATLNSVAEVVKLNTDTKTKRWRLKEFAKCAGNISRPMKVRTDHPQPSVVDRVEENSDICDRKVPVFNLQIEEAHVFYANGFLVHNCDAMTQALNDLHLHTGWKVSKANMATLRARRGW